MTRGFTALAARREPSSGKTPRIFGTWLAKHSDRGLRAPSHLELPHATLHRTSPPLGTNGHSSSETVRRPRDTSPKIHRYVAPVSASTRSKRVPTLG